MAKTGALYFLVKLGILFPAFVTSKLDRINLWLIEAYLFYIRSPYPWQLVKVPCYGHRSARSCQPNLLPCQSDQRCTKPKWLRIYNKHVIPSVALHACFRDVWEDIKRALRHQLDQLVLEEIVRWSHKFRLCIRDSRSGWQDNVFQWNI